MPIFNYTFKKIIISPSTWVIFVLSLLILSLAWCLPIGVSTTFVPADLWTTELILNSFLPMWKMLTFIVFVSLMLLVFIGVKATQIFRDEIDDGTLLILVSKPVSRNRIWAEKWLSFQVSVIGYIFLTIFIAGVFLAIPGIGGPNFYVAFAPYMGILFGISLLFDLIFTSIVLLLSLVLNGKATIAITIGFAALINIFSQAIDMAVIIPPDYYPFAQAVTVFQDVENKIDEDDIAWLKEKIKIGDYIEHEGGSRTHGVYTTPIKDLIQKVYDTENILPNDKYYPNDYDPALEQQTFKDIIADNAAHPGYEEQEYKDIKHIFNISSAFRQWKEQSIQELMTRQRVGLSDNLNDVAYGAYDLVNVLHESIEKNEVDYYNDGIQQKKMMRYFNIFYQLYYLWTGAWGDNAALYTESYNYASQNDPHIISFVENEDGTYSADLNSDSYKILNFGALISVYVILGMALLGTSWYVFNRRDFA